MRKKLLSVLLSTAMVAAMLMGCGSKEAPAALVTDTPAETEAPAADTATDAPADTAANGENYKVILITMDSIDQHWVAVDKGAQKAAQELGIEYKFMAPDKKDDAQQIERINNAVADGADAIVIAANGPDAITAALQEAIDAGVKIIYVDSPANLEAEAIFSTDNVAAAKTAGETLIKALADKGVTSGKIGIVNVNTSTQTCIYREDGFRSAFEGTDFELLETQYGEGDAAKSQDIADNYITDGCVGIYGTNEGATVGVGNAIKGSGADVLGVGFDKSDAILGLVKDGSLVATMAQNPDVMGYEGVKAAVKVLQGETLTETQVDTGVSVITADTIE